MALVIEITGSAYRPTLIVSGEMDVSNASELNEAIVSVCAQGAREIVLDLHELDFIDSVGLRAVLDGRKLCAEHECDYAIDGPLSDAVRRLFALTGASDHLEVLSQRNGHP